MNFTAIDFETACRHRASICQIGLVRTENGQVIKELNILVQPPNNYYHPIFPAIHGITPRITKNEPYFRDVWPSIEPYIRNQTVVAHNMAFDGSCLRAALRGIPTDPLAFDSQCTYRIFGKALNVLCEAFNIPLYHHDALSDARACAELYLRHLAQL